MFTCFFQVSATRQLHVYLFHSSVDDATAAFLLVSFKTISGLSRMHLFGQATDGPEALFLQRDHVLTSHFYRLALSELDVVAALRAYTKCSLDTTFSDTVRTTNS